MICGQVISVRTVGFVSRLLDASSTQVYVVQVADGNQTVVLVPRVTLARDGCFADLHTQCRSRLLSAIVALPVTLARLP